MKKKFPSEFDFHPQTFALPKDFTTLRTCHFTLDSGRKSKHTWIIKPDGGAKGKGIFLTQELAEIQYAVQSNGNGWVAQVSTYDLVSTKLCTLFSLEQL